MIYLQSICQVPNTSSAFVGMGNNNHFMAPVDQLRGELVDVTFDSARLWKEEVTDHSNIVGHLDLLAVIVIVAQYDDSKEFPKKSRWTKYPR